MVVSSVGLGFAILQIIRLRGETRAASEKTEEILPPVDVARRASLAVKAAVEVEGMGGDEWIAVVEGIGQ